MNIKILALALLLLSGCNTKKEPETISGFTPLTDAERITERSIDHTKDKPSAGSAELSKIDDIKAYVIAKQFAKQHLGDIDMGAVNDGYVNNGDGTFDVTGVAYQQGKQSIHWTIELRFKGGDWSQRSNWKQLGWVTR